MKIDKSISLPIICLLSILALGTLLTGYFINMRALYSSLTAREYDKAKTIHLSIQSFIDAESRHLLEIARALRGNGGLREALMNYSKLSESTGRFEARMTDLFPPFDDETVEVADASGRIIYSTLPHHKLGLQGDLSGMDEALRGIDMLATGKDQNGWAIRGLAPIGADGLTVGVVVVGMRIDRPFAAKLAQSTNTQIMLAKPDEVVASTLSENQLAEIDRQLIQQSLVQEDKSIFVPHEKTGRAVMYAPLRVADETFCLVVESDVSSMYRLLRQKRRHLIGVSILTLLLVFILGSALTLFLIGPLKRLRQKADHLIERFSPEVRRGTIPGNEIRALVQAFDLMTESIDKYMSEVKDGQLALKEQVHFLQTLIDSMPNPIFFKDAQGIYLGCNMAFEEYMGRSKDEIVGKSVYECWPADLADIYHEADAELLRKGGIQIYESSLMYADNTPHDVIFNKATFSKSDGSLGGLVGTILDISDRKKAEKERMQLVTAIEQAAECIIITDKDGNIQYANSAVERISGYDRNETLGQHLRMFQGDNADSGIYKTISGLLQTGESWSGHFSNRKKNGSYYEVETMISPVRDGSGAVVNYVVVARDITNEAHLERQLRQAQKMEAIGTLAGGIAHDFNNILSAIIGYTELALNDIPKESKASQRLGEVLKAGDRAKDLVTQILTFTRQSEQESRPVEIASIVQETLKFLRASLPATIQIKRNISADKAVIMADPTQLHQVLMNLCTNAAHAMEEEGGILEVNLSTVTPDDNSPPHHLDTNSGAYVKLEVKDTGYGIDPRVMERIFEPYFTTKPLHKGTGMGLAVVHGIVKSHGGTIDVRSKPGQGTIFTVLLPRMDSHKPAEDSLPRLEPPKGNERILVVDDEETLTDMLRAMLERLGYSVTVQNSGVDALELFSRRMHEFDLVITDQTMPVLTGEAFSRQVLSLRPDMPIILTTGFSERITEEKAKAIGIRALLMKPVSVGSLAATIRSVLDWRQNPVSADPSSPHLTS